MTDGPGSASLPARRATANHLAAALFFAGIAVAELWTPLVHGGVFGPADIGQAWVVTRVPGQPVAARNALQTDVYVDFLPFLHYDVAQVRAGHLPTWNPLDGNGLPYLADNQTVVLSPFTSFFYVLPFRLALLAAALARLWLLGFFTYLFLARHRMSRLAAAVGGTVFAYAGYHLVWLNYQTHVSVSALLPVALWCSRVALDHGGHTVAERRPRVLAFAGLAASTAGMVLGGHPETLVFDGLLLVLYVVVALVRETRRRPALLVRRVAPFALAATLGVGLSGAQLVPFLAYQSGSTHAVELQAHPELTKAGFLPDTVPMAAFPNLFGGPQLAYHDEAFWQRHFPQSNYAEVAGNAVGLLALGAVPVGLLALWRRRSTLAVFGAVAAVVGSLVLYASWPATLWRHVPLLGLTGLNRSQDVQLLGVAVLAALGVDWVLGATQRPAPAGGERRRGDAAGPLWHRVGTWGASYAVVTVVLVVLALHLRNVVSRLAGATTATPAGIATAHHTIELAVALAGGFALAVALLAVLRDMTDRRLVPVQFALGLGAAVAAFASNGLVLRSYNPTVPTGLLYPVTPAVAALQRAAGQGEVVFAPAMFPFASTNLWFGLHDVGSYDAVGLRWHDMLYDRVFGVTRSIDEAVPACVARLQLFGVQTVMGGPGTFTAGATRSLPPAGTIAGYPYYRVPGASEVSLVGTSVAERGDGTAMRTVSSCGFDSSANVVIDGPRFLPGDDTPPGPRHGVALGPHAVRVVDLQAGRLAIDTSASRDAWLVVRQTWAPGWQATVDGRSVSVNRVDVSFQGVRVPAGTHRVELTYRPAALTAGTALSLGSVAVGVVLVGTLLRRPKARRLVQREPAEKGSRTTRSP